MKKSVILIALSLLLSSCMNEVELNVTLRKLVSSAIKKSGAIVQGFGEQGSVSLAYSDLKEDVLANFKPVSYYCLQDNSCIYHTSVKLSGSTENYDYLVKVNSQFQIDTSFGVNGYVYMPALDIRVSNGLFGYFYFLGINSTDNTMYIGFGNGIARLLPNGKLDKTFGNKGVFILDNTAYNYFPTKIIQSNLDELLILTATAPGGGSVSTGNFGSALISVSQTGAFKSVADFNNTHIVHYRIYNNSFLFPKDIGEMLIVDNGGVNENYYAYMSNNFLMVKKTDLAGNAIAGFNFPGGGHNTTSNNYRVHKLIEVGNNIYVFLSEATSETLASKLVVFDKATGTIDAAKSKSFTNGAQTLVLDDVVKSSDGFVLSLKRCIVVSSSGDCGRANRFVAQLDINGNISNLVSVATSTGVETEKIGQARSVLQRRSSDYYVLNFSPQFVGSYGEAYTKLSVKKFDELISFDNSFGNSGEVVTSLGYSIKMSFVNLADKILLDDSINSYYLVSYEVGLKKVRKIVKLDKNINAVTAFGNAGTIDLSSFLEVNTIELDEANKLLYVVYTKANGVNKEVYLRRYNMVTGVLDTGFGSAGEFFVHSAVDTSNGYSSYYNRQVLKINAIFKPRSFIANNGFVLALQGSDRRILNLFKFDFSSELLSNKTLTSSDYPASATYSIQEIFNVYLTKKNSLFVVAKFSDPAGVQNTEILKLSGSDLSVDSSFGTNGLMFFNGGTVSQNGSITDINFREIYFVTDEYIYLGSMHQVVETDGSGNYLKLLMTPGYQRYSYSGVADTAFETLVSQQITAYTTQSNGGLKNIKIEQSMPVSKGGKSLPILLFGVYLDTIQEYMALASDADALYSAININIINIDFGEKESISNVKSKTFPFTSYMSGEITDESFLLQEAYSFDKGEYVYKVAVSGLDTEGQPVYKLYKLYN